MSTTESVSEGTRARARQRQRQRRALWRPQSARIRDPLGERPECRWPLPSATDKEEKKEEKEEEVVHRSSASRSSDVSDGCRSVSRNAYLFSRREGKTPGLKAVLFGFDRRRPRRGRSSYRWRRRRRRGRGRRGVSCYSHSLPRGARERGRGSVEQSAL